MSDYSSNKGANFSAGIDMKPSAPIGSMGRKSMYKVEAFPPVDLPTVKWLLGDNYAKHEQSIRDILVPCGGDHMAPVGELVALLGEDATLELKEQLFSRPLWVEEVPNLVVMAGLTDSLDKHFKGSAYTAAWYVGLVSGTPTFAEGNTMASHSGWVEVVPYAGARPTLTLGTVVSGSVDNSASKATYTINATMVVGGAFVVTLPTAGQTSGTIYGGAAFTGGNRSVTSGDTLNVTTTLTATAA